MSIRNRIERLEAALRPSAAEPPDPPDPAAEWRYRVIEALAHLDNLLGGLADPGIISPGDYVDAHIASSLIRRSPRLAAAVRECIAAWGDGPWRRPVLSIEVLAHAYRRQAGYEGEPIPIPPDLAAAMRCHLEMAGRMPSEAELLAVIDSPSE